VFRTTLSGNKISGTKDFAIGPFEDIGFQLGGDYDVQNDQFGSYKRLLVAGPEFDVALPKGFWTISPQISHEWDTNGFAAPEGPRDSFAPTYEIETAWLYPFAIGPVPLQFTGFANLIGPKGRGYSEPTPYTGDFYHKTEILFHPKLLVDVGSLVGYTPGKLMAGVGYEFWMNKFGSYKPYVEGTQQSSVFFEVGYHFGS
jgi:nucleoside-specific outer membrane channel protein Tsx